MKIVPEAGYDTVRKMEKSDQ